MKYKDFIYLTFLIFYIVELFCTILQHIYRASAILYAPTWNNIKIFVVKMLYECTILIHIINICTILEQNKSPHLRALCYGDL